MKTLVTSIGALIASATVTLAADPLTCELFPDTPTCATAVPEISALEGTAAIAALAAIVLLAWERRRRAAA